MAAILSPQSGVRNVHVNTLLSQFSIAYHPTGLVADQVFPVVPVAKESDVYLTWDKGQAFRVLRTDGYGSLKADKAEAKTLDFGATWTNYTAEEWAYRIAISDREKANADDAFQLETSKVRFMQDLVLLDFEIRVAKILTTAANYTGANTNVVTNSGATQWNNSGFASIGTTGSGHSAIAAQFYTGINVIRQNTGGRLPNLCIIPYTVAQVMRNDPGLIDLIKYQIKDINADVLPDNLWGMKVLIPRGQVQTAVEGEAVNPSDIWGKNVVLAYVDPSPGIGTLTTGITLRQRPWQVKTWRQEWQDLTMYQASFVQTEKLVTSDTAYLIAAAVA